LRFIRNELTVSERELLPVDGIITVWKWRLFPFPRLSLSVSQSGALTLSQALGPPEQVPLFISSFEVSMTRCNKLPLVFALRSQGRTSFRREKKNRYAHRIHGIGTGLIGKEPAFFFQ